jgi:hypothetical protein
MPTVHTVPDLSCSPRIGTVRGTFPRAEAQSHPPLPTGIKVEFDPSTKPEADGSVCKDKEYKIRASPWVQDLDGNQTQYWLFNNHHGDVRAKGAIGTITPTLVKLKAYESPAVFDYSSEDVGKETLTFTASIPAREYNPGDGDPVWMGWFQTATAPFIFDVIDCHPSVAMTYSVEQSVGAVFGYLADTKLTETANGTFEGDGPFYFQQIIYVAPCTANFTEITSQTHVTGNIAPKTHKLTLNFQYGPAETTLAGSCPILGGFSSSHNIDVDSLGVTSATFPEGGGSKSYPALGGNFTITVTQENSGTAMRLGK